MRKKKKRCNRHNPLKPPYKIYDHGKNGHGVKLALRICRDSGKGGEDAGVLCLSWWQHHSVALCEAYESPPHEDRHKAPTSTPHPPPVPTEFCHTEESMLSFFASLRISVCDKRFFASLRMTYSRTGQCHINYACKPPHSPCRYPPLYKTHKLLSLSL